MMRWCAGLSVGLFLACGFAGASELLTFNITSQPGSEHYAVLWPFAQSVCAKAGLACQFVNLPLGRAVDKMRLGEIDGEFGRVREFAAAKGLNGIYLLVDAPFLPTRTVILTRGGDPPVASWNQLTGSPFRVGYPRGTYIYEARLQASGVKAIPVPLELTGQCPRMLIADGLVQRGPGVETYDTYMFVSSRHPELVPLLKRAIEQK